MDIEIIGPADSALNPQRTVGRNAVKDNLADINRMLDSFDNHLRACDARESSVHKARQDREKNRARAPKSDDRPLQAGVPFDADRNARQAQRHFEARATQFDNIQIVRENGDDDDGDRNKDSGARRQRPYRDPMERVIIADENGDGTDAQEMMIVMVDAASGVPTTARAVTSSGSPRSCIRTEIFGDARAVVAYGAGGASAQTFKSGVLNGHDDAEPWAAPGEWWNTGIRCVFDWLREAFAATLDREAVAVLERHRVVAFFAWPPVHGGRAAAGAASAASSLTLMLRPWTPTDRPADVERGAGGGPRGIESRRDEAERDLLALTTSAEGVVARVESGACVLGDRHAALSEAVRGCAACLRTLVSLARNEIEVLRDHGTATREAAVIATRAAAIAQKWVYARSVERINAAARRYSEMEVQIEREFDHADGTMRAQRTRFLHLWRDLKTRYDAFLVSAGLEDADPAAVQAMDALFWRRAGSERPLVTSASRSFVADLHALKPSFGNDGNRRDAECADGPVEDATGVYGEERQQDADDKGFDADALRLLHYYCEHMASVARSMLDGAVDANMRSAETGSGAKIDCKRGAADGSGVSSEMQRRTAAWTAGGDDRARILAEMKRARDRCRSMVRIISARRRDRAQRLRPIRRRHTGRLRRRDLLRKQTQDGRLPPESQDQEDSTLEDMTAALFEDEDGIESDNPESPLQNAHDSEPRDDLREVDDPIVSFSRAPPRERRGSEPRRRRTYGVSSADEYDSDSDARPDLDTRWDRDLVSNSDDDTDDIDDDDDLDSDGDGDIGGGRVKDDNMRFKEIERIVAQSRAEQRQQARGPTPQSVRFLGQRSVVQIANKKTRNEIDTAKAGGEDARKMSRALSDQQQLDAAAAADARDARAEETAREKLAGLEALMSGMAAHTIESGPHAAWVKAIERLASALAEAQDAWRLASQARTTREAILEEETARCLDAIATSARATHESDVGAVLSQWNDQQHAIDRRRADDLRQIGLARRVAEEWLSNFERKMVYYHEDKTCADAVAAVSEFRSVMRLHAAARDGAIRIREFVDAFEDLSFTWALAYKVEYGADGSSTQTRSREQCARK